MMPQFKKCDFCARTVKIGVDGRSYRVEIDGGLYKVCSRECEAKLRDHNKKLVMEMRNGGVW